ncbi:MAG: cyclase family protein [Chloroflexota bacterium]
MKIFDLNVPLEDSPSEPLPVTIEHQQHEDSAAMMASFFEASIDDLPNGLGWGNDNVAMNAHSGTHVDAPWHYYPTCGNTRARTIDELPLEWFYGDGVVLDMRHKPKGGLISTAEVQEALEKINYTLKPGDIVMIQTGADKLWGQAEYFQAGAGMSAEATRWLIEQGIRVMGIDTWGWDQPFWAMKERFKETGDPSVIWEAHRVGMDLEYCQIEKLANLDQLPRPYGFKVTCFPVKLAGGSAGWTRVTAIFEDLDE